MKKLKPLYILLVLISSLLLTNCSSSDDDPNENDPNNNAPGIFSAHAFDATVDGASVDWTESIDTDDDVVTYAIFLEGSQVASGLTKGQTYTFSGLEPETIYQGYVEARDGRGGTSIADFSFGTEPVVIIFNVNASSWIKDHYPEQNFYRTILRGGFIIPYFENATSYQIEILDYGWVDPIYSIGDDHIGNIYTWTNDSQTTPIGPVFADQPIDGDYSAALTGASISTAGGPDYDAIIARFNTIYGEARVTVTIGN